MLLMQRVIKFLFVIAFMAIALLFGVGSVIMIDDLHILRGFSNERNK